jgi:hypothetical protein
VNDDRVDAVQWGLDRAQLRAGDEHSSQPVQEPVGTGFGLSWLILMRTHRPRPATFFTKPLRPLWAELRTESRVFS